MFRQKALKKYGGDMLPKFQEGGGALDRFFFPKSDPIVDVNKVAGIPSLAQPYDSRQAMLLAVAGRLLQAEQRPGEGVFAGVGRGVGKAITEDFPIIKKLDLESRASKTTAINKTNVYDKTQGVNRTVPFSDIEADPNRFIREQPQKFNFSVSEEVTVDTDTGKKTYSPGKTYTLPTEKDFYDVFRTDKFLNLKNVIIGPQGDIEAAIELKGKQDLRNEFLKQRPAVDERGRAALQVNNMVVDALDNIENKGALTGAVGGFNIAIANLRGFISPFVRKSSNLENNYDEQIDDMNAFLNGEVTIYDPRRKKSVGINEIFTSDKVAALSADQRTLVTELAYTLAKSREEGGRFSVSDIELALKSIGDYSNPELAKASLIRVGNLVSERNIGNMKNFYESYQDRGLTGKMYELPKFYNELQEYYGVFRKGDPSNPSSIQDIINIKKLTFDKDLKENVKKGNAVTDPKNMKSKVGK